MRQNSLSASDFAVCLRRVVQGPKPGLNLFIFLQVALVLLAGCERRTAGTDIRKEVEERIAKIATLHDPKALRDAREGLYAMGPPAIEPLSDPILSTFDQAQPQLIAALSAIPDPRSDSILFGLLRSRYPDRRRQALHGLALRPLPPPNHLVLVRITRSKLASDREWALYALDRTQDLSTRDAFMARVDDSDPDVRMQAARGLRLFPGAATVTTLERLMDDKMSGVATEAMISLGRIDPGNAKVEAQLRRLQPLVKSGSTNQKEELAPLVAESETPLGETMLASMLGDPDPRVRAAAANAYPRLGSINDPKPLLRSLETDPDPYVRPRVARAIAALRITSAVPIFRKMVFGKNRSDARMAAVALKDICDPMSVGILIGMLKVPDFEIRRLAAVGQMRMAIGKPEYFSLIDQMLADASSPSAESRRAAASYLADLPGPQAAARLEALESDPDAGVRLAAMDGRKKQMGMSRVVPDVIEHPRPSWLDPTK